MRHQFNPPNTNALTRVMYIRSAQCGAGFIVDYQNKQYLVTVAHMIADDFGSSIDVFVDDDFKSYPARLLNLDRNRDVAIIKFEKSEKRFPLPLDAGGLIYGQFVYFLGFPFLQHTKADIHFQGRLPFPYVKWGAISSMEFGADQTLVLDAINNIGFSGGPVVFNHTDGSQKICGMITGMKEEVLPLQGIKENDPTIGYFKQTTGLTYAATAASIKAAIDVNPDGVPIM